MIIASSVNSHLRFYRLQNISLFLFPPPFVFISFLSFSSLRISLDTLYIHSAPASFFQKMVKSPGVLVNIGRIAFSQSQAICLRDSQEEARWMKSFPPHVRTCQGQSSRCFFTFPPLSWTLPKKDKVLGWCSLSYICCCQGEWHQPPTHLWSLFFTPRTFVSPVDEVVWTSKS